MSLAIECTNLKIRYRSKSCGTINAVNNLSFSVSEGEIVGFLGPNGAGKSSTLKALMGFVQAESGQARIFGLPAGGQAARSKVGYLPEVAMYYPYLTPIETLTLYGELQGLGGRSLREQALDLLELLGVANAAKKLNRTLSKGMVQRVGIAQALLGDPKLLILDEVTSGLDPLGRRELRELLLERSRAGTTLFFSSHELGEVANICDRILILDQGRLIEERKLGELQDSLRKYTLLFKSPPSGLGFASQIQPDGSQFAEFDSKHQLMSAMRDVFRVGGDILDIVSADGSLEDYFIDAIGRAA